MLLTLQLLSYMLGNSSNLEASIKRAERFIDTLPKAWLKGGAPQSATPLSEQLKKLARVLESKRKDGLPGMKPLARRLASSLESLGLKEASNKLTSAYKL